MLALLGSQAAAPCYSRAQNCVSFLKTRKPLTMRVIAGTAKGARLEAPKGRKTRPTLDRVREALFSILGAKVADARVLDLYAGTGAIGIEALSRGAAYCEFVENDAECIAHLQRNLEAARVESRAKIRRLRLPDDLSRLGRTEKKYDVIYADPPFDFADYPLLCSELVRNDLLRPDSIVIIEHDARTSLAECPAGLVCFRQAHYGKTFLSFFIAGETRPETQ